MDRGHQIADSGRLHVWLENQAVVAAVWIWRDGYYWCQSWDTPDLPDVALAAAEAWSITPDSPPSDDMWGALAWLRAVLPLGTRGGRFDDLALADVVPADGPEDLVRRLVCSGLAEPGDLTTLTWPTLATDSVGGVPDPLTAAAVADRLRSLNAQVAEAAARDHEAQARRLSEWAHTRDDADAAPRSAEVDPYAEVVLSADDFVNAVVDGATEVSLHAWADALLEAVERAAAAGGARDSAALGHLLRSSVEIRRREIDPFAEVVEATGTIHKWWQIFADDLADLTEQRNDVYRVVLHELAGAYYNDAGGPFRWKELIELGAWPVRPHPPGQTDL